MTQPKRKSLDIKNDNKTRVIEQDSWPFDISLDKLKSLHSNDVEGCENFYHQHSQHNSTHNCMQINSYIDPIQRSCVWLNSTNHSCVEENKFVKSIIAMYCDQCKNRRLYVWDFVISYNHVLLHLLWAGNLSY